MTRGLGNGAYIVDTFGDDVGFYAGRDLFSLQENEHLARIAEMRPVIASWPRLALQLLSAVEARGKWVTRVISKLSDDSPLTLDILIASWERAAAWQRENPDEAKSTSGYAEYDLMRFVATAKRVRELVTLSAQAA